jgi:hypothetical protein
VCGSPDCGFFLFNMNERSYLILDLVRSNILDLNPTESILASCLFGLLAQNPIQYAGKPYYMADYKNVAVYCSILPDKVDTLRRLYKRLENIGLIEIIKIDNHIYFTPSQMLRDWGTVYKSDEAEKNPVKAEKNPVKAEKNPVKAEKNPLYINNINNNINNNIKPQLEFAANIPIKEPEESKDKKTLFRNSEIYKLVKFDEAGAGVDYSEFEKRFATPEFERVDLVYYFHAVADWSDQKNMKRTKNGWLATVRNFIRGDVERNKLHVKLQYQQSTSKINVYDAVKFLNDDF